MKVKAEIRDLRYKKKAIKLVLPIIFEPLVMILFAAIGFTNEDVIPSWLTISCLILGGVIFLALTVRAGVKANKEFKESWLVEEFEFVAINGKLTMNGKPMHTIVHPRKRVIYVNDLGDTGKPYVASFYATVFEDYDVLLQYIEENGVKKEKEKLPKGPGRYGSIAPMAVLKYRRR